MEPAKDKEEKHNDLSTVSFCMELGKYLNSNESLDDLLKIVKNKINTDISKMEKILLNLIIILNPKTQNYSSDINKLLIFKILKYLNDNKDKSPKNPMEIYNIFAQIFSNIPLYKLLFENDNNLNGKEELYLEFIIPFIPDKQINLIIKSLKSYIKDDEVTYIEEILNSLDLKLDKGFIFLKNILITIVNYHDRNLIHEINNTRNNYLSIQKNELLRCKKCYNLPQLILNEENKITIKYQCKHVEDKDIINPENIKNYKSKCCECDNDICIFYKNYLCSNCKCLLCSKCLQNHFNKCLTLFFIPSSDIGFICTDHNKKYEYFCTICNMNLCQKCKVEHEHYTKYSLKPLNKEEKQKIKNNALLDEKNKSLFTNLITLIISNDKYLNNIQFQYFFDNLLGKKDLPQSGLFIEFGDVSFNQYYSELIQAVKNGNLYYNKVYDKIIMIYNKEGKIINEHDFSARIMYTKAVNMSKIYNDNNFKGLILTNYFICLNEIKEEIYQQSLKLEKEALKIKEEKLKIKANSLLFNNNKYIHQSTKLLKRSISENIIRYLINNYPKNFQKIQLNLKIYNDIQENYKNKKNIINKMEFNERDKIFNYIDKLRSKLNNNINNRNEEEEDTDDSDENITNLLQFVSPIKIKDSEISVKDLNLILNYLLFTKDDGNYAAHPNDKNKNIPFSRNNLCKDKNQKLDSKISKEETEQFIQELIKSFQSWNYNVNASNKFLFECLFDEKYDNLLLKIQGSNEEKEIREILKRENDDGIISVELTKIEQSLNGFKLLRNSMIKYKTDKLNKNISLKDFFGRLLKSFNNKDTALAILNNITGLEYENALFGDMPIFISDCFDYIINNLLKKYENIFKELEAQLENLKVENRKRTTILEIFRLLNEETAHLEEQDKLNKKYFDEKNFIDYLNEGKEDNEKIKYSEINNIKETIRKNLEKLLIGKIDWTKYHNEKMTTSLYLNQNKN